MCALAISRMTFSCAKFYLIILVFGFLPLPLCVSHEDTRSQWSTLHLLSSLGFGISYFLFRLVLFPVLIIWFSADLIRFPGDTWFRMSTFELLAYPVATLTIFGLSVKWSVPVARGTLQSLHRLVQQEVKST